MKIDPSIILSGVIVRGLTFGMIFESVMRHSNCSAPISRSHHFYFALPGIRTTVSIPGPVQIKHFFQCSALMYKHVFPLPRGNPGGDGFRAI